MSLPNSSPSMQRQTSLRQRLGLNPTGESGAGNAVSTGSGAASSGSNSGGGLGAVNLGTQASSRFSIAPRMPKGQISSSGQGGQTLSSIMSGPASSRRPGLSQQQTLPEKERDSHTGSKREKDLAQPTAAPSASSPVKVSNLALAISTDQMAATSGTSGQPIPERVEDQSKGPVSPIIANSPTLPSPYPELSPSSQNESQQVLTAVPHKCTHCGHVDNVQVPSAQSPTSGDGSNTGTVAKASKHNIPAEAAIALANFRETLQQEKWLRKKDKSLEAFALAAQAKQFELEAECERLRSALAEQIATNRTLYHNFLEALDECQKRVEEADARVAEARRDLRNEEAKVAYTTAICNSTRAELEKTRKSFLTVTQYLCAHQILRNYRLYHRILRVLELVSNLRDVVFGPGGLGPENLPTSELLEVYENNARFRKRFNAFKSYQPGNYVRRPKASQLLDLLQDSLDEFIVPLRRIVERVNNLVSVNDAFFKRNIALSATTQQLKSKSTILRDEVEELRLKLTQTEQQLLKYQHYLQPNMLSGPVPPRATSSSAVTRPQFASTESATSTALTIPEKRPATSPTDTELALRLNPESLGSNTPVNRASTVLGPTTPTVNVPALYYRTPFVPVRVRGSATLNWNSTSQGGTK